MLIAVICLAIVAVTETAGFVYVIRLLTFAGKARDIFELKSALEKTVHPKEKAVPPIKGVFKT
jgi:hypothetical protein